MKIYKYPVDLLNRGKFTLDLPVGAEVLSAQVQNGRPNMWVRVDPDKPTTKRHFQIIGTGHEFDDTQLDYLVTYQQGAYVWHLFEVLGESL